MRALASVLAWIWMPMGLAPAVAQTHAGAHEKDSAHSTIVFVARRGWHIDIGFAASDLEPPLNSLAAEFPGVEYLFFGFGDQHYLLAKKHNAPVLLGALWPGRGMLLATGLAAAPQDAFGAAQVVALAVTPQQLHAVQDYVWQTLDAKFAGKPAARGPYGGSLYFDATPKYSALHTCNTWAAQALKAAGLPIHSGGVVFAGQLWSQVRRLSRAASCRPGKRLSFPTLAAPPRWCSFPAQADCCC